MNQECLLEEITENSQPEEDMDKECLLEEITENSQPEEDMDQECLLDEIVILRRKGHDETTPSLVK